MSETEVEFKVGFLNLDEYRLGEKITIGEERKKSLADSEPMNGIYNEAGYVECPICAQDYFLNIAIENDVILYPEIKSFGWRKE